MIQPSTVVLKTYIIQTVSILRISQNYFAVSSSPPDQASWGNIIFRCGIVTATHPIDYAKTLIQLGYEPIAPKPTTTFLGRPALGLPSVFKYSKYKTSINYIKYLKNKSCLLIDSCSGLYSKTGWFLWIVQRTRSKNVCNHHQGNGFSASC